MKTSDATLRALLHGSQTAAFCNLVTLTTRSATTVRWAAAAYDVVYGGNTYTGGGSGTAPLVQPMRIREAVGLEVSTLELALDCGTSAQIGGVALQNAALNGVLDDARVTVLRVYMATPGGAVVGTAIQRFAGVVSDCEVDSYSVRLRVQSDLYKLEEQLPRHLIREKCSWAFGDAGCGVNIASFTTTGVSATGASTSSKIYTNIPVAFFGAVSWVGGTVKFTGGALSGQTRSITAFSFYTAGANYLIATVEPPFSQAPAISDPIEVAIGCDKTNQTCLTVFSGGVKTAAPFTRRRGFDFVPPPDYVTR